jgi:hypothetical protein
MAGPGDVRAGGAYVEISADNGKLKKDLVESEATLGSAIKKIKSKFGEESVLGNLAKTLVGAGAVAGIGLAANKFAQMGAAVESAATRFRAGQISYSQYVSELVKSVPIIGDVISGIESIGEAITGAKAKADAVRAAQAGARGVIDGPGFKDGGFDAEGAEARARRIEANLNTKNLSPLERARIEAANPYTDRIAEINAGRKSAVDAVREKNQKQIDDLQGIVNAPRSKVSDIQRAEANSKLEQIQIQIEQEIGRIKKAAATEIAANMKAREAAIGTPRKRTRTS